MSEHDQAPMRLAPPEPIPYASVLRYSAQGEPLEAPPNVHQAMAKVMELVTAVGKTGRNVEQGYTFRSIDKFMDALNPAMSEAGVHVVPKVLTRSTDEKVTRSGARMRLVDLEVAFTFYGPAGDSVVAVAWGEGSDTSDKATNKAMTGAFKYAIVQAFMVPTSDLSDADQHTTEVPTDAESRANAQAEADASPEVVEELRQRALAISQQPKPDRAKALAALWKDAQKARALGATTLVPAGWREMVGQEHLALHALITGVRETDQLPPHGEGLAAGEQVDTESGEVQAPEQPTGEPCPAVRESDGGRCEKPAGHTGRHSYLAHAEPLPPEPGTDPPAEA